MRSRCSINSRSRSSARVGFCPVGWNGAMKSPKRMRSFDTRLDRPVNLTGNLAQMRAAVARRGALVVEDVADPVLGPGDVLVAVKACGICGSDLHALHYADELVAITREMGVPIGFDPTRDFIMGHEFTGEVLELGPMTDGA